VVGVGGRESSKSRGADDGEKDRQNNHRMVPAVAMGAGEMDRSPRQRQRQRPGYIFSLPFLYYDTKVHSPYNCHSPTHLPLQLQG
jgi:hypothetical protein